MNEPFICNIVHQKQNALDSAAFKTCFPSLRKPPAAIMKQGQIQTKNPCHLRKRNHASLRHASRFQRNNRTNRLIKTALKIMDHLLRTLNQYVVIGKNIPPIHHPIQMIRTNQEIQKQSQNHNSIRQGVGQSSIPNPEDTKGIAQNILKQRHQHHRRSNKTNLYDTRRIVLFQPWHPKQFWGKHEKDSLML